MTPFEFNKQPIDVRYDDYCRGKAEELFSEKVPDIGYKVSGLIGCREVCMYFGMTAEEIDIIKTLQQQNPGEDVSYLLEANGYEDKNEEFAGEDGFWVKDIDWTPRKLYRFSLVQYSKFSLKAKPKEEVSICLEDEEYIQLLTSRVISQEFNFNALVAGNPDLAQRIMSQLVRNDEPFGNHSDPFVLYMDEIEEDAQKIKGAPVFSCSVYSVNEDEEDISFYVSKNGIDLIHTKQDDCEVLNVATGMMSSYMENTERLTDISFAAMCKLFDESDPEILLEKLCEQFCGEEAFIEFKSFLDDKKEKYVYKQDKMLV